MLEQTVLPTTTWAISTIVQIIIGVSALIGTVIAVLKYSRKRK